VTGGPFFVVRSIIFDVYANVKICYERSGRQVPYADKLATGTQLKLLED